MAANYVLPDVVEKRTRFFDGQFLQDQDFVDEQNYHVDRQRRHNRLLHVSGIAEGLTVSVPAANQVAVSPGTAIDSDGRQLALAQAATVDLPAERFNDKQGIELYVAYQESAEDRQTGQGSDDFTRWLERPQMIAVPPGDSYSGSFPPVLLATLALDGAGRVTVDTTVCTYAGARLPGPSADAASLRATAAGSVDLAGSLTVDGNVGVGTASPGAKLEVAGGGGLSVDLLVNGRLRSNNNDGGLWVAGDRLVGGFDTNKIGFYNANAWRFAVLNNGYVGIGTTTPSAMLTVNGDLTFAAAPTTIRADGGRLHITGGEILYLLNKSGVVVGREWGGNGNVTVEGNVGIGTAINDTSNQRLCVSGTTWLKGDTFITGRFVMQINDTTWWGIGPRESLGVQWAAYYGTGGPDTSDVRLKADLRPITHAVGMVRMLQGVRYRWGDSGLKYFTQGIDRNLSAGPNATDDQSDRIREYERRKALKALAGDRLGLVAQDVETVIPELVHEDGDGYKHIRYQHLTALLVEAIKEQDATVRALSAQVAALSTRQPDRAVRRGGGTEHA
jgi:endosialidase-like protein